MKALILAGGEAIRLRPLTDTTNKILVKIGDKTILERTVGPFIESGVNDFVFLVGRLDNQVKDFVKKNYPQIKATYISDPPKRDPKGRYIDTMWEARKAVQEDDIIFTHGDIFCHPSLIRKIVEFSYSGALVQKNFVPQKDFKARVENGLITKIGVDVFGKNTGFCLPVYKFLKDDFKLWMGQIGKFVKSGRVDCYAEDALNEVLDKMKFYPVYYEKEYGMEVDDFEDLKKAEKLLKG